MDKVRKESPEEHLRRENESKLCSSKALPEEGLLEINQQIVFYQLWTINEFYLNLHVEVTVPKSLHHLVQPFSWYCELSARTEFTVWVSWCLIKTLRLGEMMKPDGFSTSIPLGRGRSVTNHYVNKGHIACASHAVHHFLSVHTLSAPQRMRNTWINHTACSMSYKLEKDAADLPFISLWSLIAFPLYHLVSLSPASFLSIFENDEQSNVTVPRRWLSKHAELWSSPVFSFFSVFLL